MLLKQPLPFREAVESRTVRQLLPTELRTQLLDTLPAELRERAVFSAGVSNVEFLQRISDGIDSMLAGKSDRATQRAELKQLLTSLDYRPAQGEEGTLTDLSSDRRLNLILDQNLAMARGYGQWAQGQLPGVLEQWPCKELVRVRDAAQPRDWESIWAANGGKFYEGRMIARKDDPIWVRISRFRLPYPPYDFGSGMGDQDIDRDEAELLGVITPEEQTRPQSRDFNTDLAATPQVRDAALKEGLLESLGAGFEFVSGILRLVRT